MMFLVRTVIMEDAMAFHNGLNEAALAYRGAYTHGLSIELTLQLSSAVPSDQKKWPSFCRLFTFAWGWIGHGLVVMTDDELDRIADEILFGFRPLRPIYSRHGFLTPTFSPGRNMI
jgi:hypothetical protein